MTAKHEPMQLHVLFIQRTEDYPGQHAPEARLVWDEYSVDENPEGFEEAIASDLAKCGDDVEFSRVITLEVDHGQIREILCGTPKISARVIADT